MDPPTYEEVVEQGNTTPPPNYENVVLPSTPPPTYMEADAFPVLTLPTVHTATAPEPATQVPVVHVQPQCTVAVLGSSPAAMRCPYCHEDVTTEVEHKPGQAAWSVCLLFTVLGCICGCCLIPFVAHGLQDVHHSCPRCHRHLHIHTR